MTEPLELSALGQTRDSYGCMHWSMVTNMINHDGVPNFGSAISQIWVTLFCNGAVTRPTPTHPIAKLFAAEIELPPLDMQASVRFLRKTGELNIIYPSTRFTPDEAEAVGLATYTRAEYRRACADLTDALEWGLNKRLKPQDDFDVAGFLDWVRAYESLELDSDETLRMAVQSGIDAHRARIAAADPWTLLDVNWRKMHPKARDILNAPQGWSVSDPYAPHGSDAGADIFADWRGYKSLDPMQAAERLGWAKDACNAANPLFRADWVAIHLALAIGHIKTKADCPAALAKATLVVLEAELSQIDAMPPAQDIDAQRNRLNRYARIIRDLQPKH